VELTPPATFGCTAVDSERRNPSAFHADLAQNQRSKITVNRWMHCPASQLKSGRTHQCRTPSHCRCRRNLLPSFITVSAISSTRHGLPPNWAIPHSISIRLPKSLGPVLKTRMRLAVFGPRQHFRIMAPTSTADLPTIDGGTQTI
jgi:hypothetical protein